MEQEKSEFVRRQERLRGGILELIFERHHNQQTRFSDVTLWSMLLRVGFSLGQDEVVTVLQDLCDREYVRFEEDKNRRTGRTSLAMIQITPKGRDLIERRRTDEAISL